MLKIRDFLFLLFYLLFTVSNAYAIPPAAPKIDKNIVIEDGTVTLNWTAVSGADSYNLYRGLKSGAETLIKNKIKDTKVTIPGVNGSQYFFKLKAVNSAGEESPFSNEVSAILTLSKPQIKAIQTAAGRVIIGWPAVNGATNYFIYESTIQNNPSPKQLTGFAINLNKTTNEYYVTISGLNEKDTHYFKIKAVNSEEINEFSSDFSNEIEVVALGKPNTPVLISAVPGSEQITLNWSPAVGATTYNVYQGTVAGGEGETPLSGENIIIKETSAIISNLDNGTQYFFKITAVNPGGKSAFSNELSATPINPDAIAVSKVTLTVGSKTAIADGNKDGNNRILLRAGVEINDNKPAVGVTVQFTTGTGKIFDQLSGGKETSTAQTDSNGIAQLFLEVPTKIGKTIVRANANGVISDEIELTFVAGPVESINLTATSTMVNTGSTATLRATALDANTNPVTDSISFGFVTNGSNATIDSITSANGVTTATYNAGSQAGEDTIQASVNGVVSNKIKIKVNSVIGSIALTALPQNVIADDSNKIELSATVKEDQTGNPAVGVMVNFTATAGTLQNNTGGKVTAAQTNNSGVAKLFLVAPIYSGSATVTATISGFTANTTVNFIAGPAETITLTANPSKVNARGESTIQIKVSDKNNNPLIGELVNCTIDPNNSGGTVANTAKTDSNGQATITYTAGIIGGTTDTIKVKSRSNGKEGSVNVVVNALSINKVELITGTDQVVADDKNTVAVRATVTDIDNNPVENIAVSFSTTSGNLSANTANTNGSGIAEIALTAPNLIGNATITATVSGFNDTKTVKFIAGKPAQLSLTAIPTTVNLYGESTLQATVLDVNGNPVANELINFLIEPNNSDGNLDAITKATGENGRVEIKYTAGNKGGNDIVHARATNNTNKQVSITVNAPLIGEIKLATGSESIVADKESTVAIRATVTDSAKNPAVGITVNFATTAGKLSAKNSVTNSQGIAEVALTAPIRIGNATLTASVSGFTDTATVKFTAGAPQNITLTQPLTDVNPSSSVNLTASVTDFYNNPVAGETVTFLLEEKGSTNPSLSAITAITDENGQAGITYTAGKSVGTDKLKAETTTRINTTISIKVSTPVAARLALATNKVAVKSDNSDADNSDSATITATVLDGNNAVLAGVTVNFSADGGQISTASGVTDKDGKVNVIFSAGEDPTNRTAIISATIQPIGVTEAITREIPIQIIGTTLTLTAPSTSLSDDQTTKPIEVEVLVTNAATQPVFDTPVCFAVDNKSEKGDLTLMENIDTSPELNTSCSIKGISELLDIKKEDIKQGGKTDVTGRVKIKVAGKTTGKPKLIAYAAGASDTQQFIVDPMNLKITAPNKTPVPALKTGNTQVITVNAPNAKNVTFSTSLGKWENADSVTTVTVTNGTASATLTSVSAGTATILVSDANNYLSSDTITILFSTPFNAADAKLLFQAAPRVVPVSSGTVKYTSTLTAVLLTKKDQPIADVLISFTMESVTGSGETISPPFVPTDIAGKATAKFTSGASATSADGLTIQASVPGTELKKTFKMVVTDKAGSLILGISNQLKTAANETVYTLPMSVLVADANGNPVSNSEVALSVWPEQYSSGIRDRIDYDNISNGAAIITDTFDNEDLDENLILDDTEDFNGDEHLTPANSAGGSLIQKITTDALGLQSFDLIYPKSSAEWIVDRIRASTFVQGTEMISEMIFRLPALKADIFGDTPKDSETGGTLSDSPYNPICPYKVKASKDTLYIAPGGSKSLTLTLKGKDIKVPASSKLNEHPVTALVVNKPINYNNVISSTWLNATASIGQTDKNGKFDSTVTIPNNIYAIGITTQIHYFVSCAGVTINLVAADATLASEKPSILNINAQPDKIAPNGDATITAYVLDAAKNPLAGQRVDFTISQNNSGGSLSIANATTDENGKATITYSAGSLSKIDPITGKITDTIVATTTGETTISNQVLISVEANIVEVQSININVGAKEVPVGGGIPVTIRATVTDVNNKLAAGVPVTFMTTAGTFQNATVPGNTIQINTNAKGLATAMLLSGNEVGTAIIYANANGFVKSELVDFTVGPPKTIKLNATPNVVTTSSGTSKIVATVTDAYGNGVGKDQKIRFAVTGNGSITPQSTTDENSQASATYTAGADAETATITATLPNGENAKTVINVSSGPAMVGSVTLTTAQNTLTADGISQSAVTVTVKDSSGKPLTGKTVVFSTNNGTLSSVSGITDVNGNSTVTLIAPKIIGVAMLTATVDNVPRNVQVQFVAGAPNNITINLSPSIVNPKGATLVNATLKDSLGNVIAGAELKFSVPSNTSKGKFSVNTATTNFNGQVAVRYVAGAATAETTDVLQVTSATDAQVSSSAYLTIAPGAVIVKSVTLAVSNSTLAVSNSTLPADKKSTTTLRATVLDSEQNPAPGIKVTFTTTGGTIKPTTAITNANGIATATLTAAQYVGNAVLSATANGVSSTVQTIEFTAGAPEKISLNAAPNKINPNGSTNLQAIVSDANQNPVEGVLVNFLITSNKSDGKLNAVYATTNEIGKAEVSYTAGAKNGTDKITARLSDGKSDAVEVIVNANATVINSIEVSSGADSVVANKENTVAIRAVIKDSDQNLAEGVTVNFTTTAGKLSAQTAVTNNSGIAEIMLTAPPITGRAVVTGTANGFSSSTTVTFIAGKPNKITLSAKQTVLNAQKITTITATVLDANNNTVAGGERINFSITNKSGGTLSTTWMPTDMDGQASVIYTAGTKSGTDKIQAQLSNGVQATINITVKAFAVNKIEVFTADSLIADGVQQAAIKALVYDTNDDLVPNVTVTFSTTNGTLVANNSAQTDINGTATVFLTAPSKIGSAKIIATTGPVAGNTTIQFVAGQAATITLNANPSTLAPTAQTTLTATVKDANDNPVKGDNLRFTLTTNASQGALKTTSGVTNDNGEATVTYTAGTAGAGSSIVTDIITVVDTSVDSAKLLPVTQDLSIDPKAILLNSLTLAVVNNITKLTADGKSTALIRATVQQRSPTTGTSVAASGITIDFTSTSGTLSAESALTDVNGIADSVESAITDENGIADVVLTAPEKTSTATIKAQTSGLAASTVLEFLADTPNRDKSSLTANPGTLAADGTSTSTITVKLADANGNLVADDTKVTLVTTAGTITSDNPALTLSGRATFTLQAPNSPATTTLSIAQLPELTTDVTFGSASTGNPASINLVVGTTRIAVAGVGQTENTTLSIQVKDDAGNPIDETGYNNPDVNNIRVSFITHPNGGEYIGGVNAAKTVCTTLTGGDETTCPGTEAGPIYLRTTKGSLTMNIQAGTLPGILEGKIEVLLDKDGVYLVNPVTASLPQVVIASGPPHTITLTSQATDSLENPKKGVYRITGTAIVTDRYGNNVPDGTAINLGLIDSVLAQGINGKIAAGVNTLTGGTSLITSDLGETFDFRYKLKRNNTYRGIQAKDRVLIENAQAQDKSRFVNKVQSGTKLTVQSNYLGKQLDAIYTVGASLLGGSIAGVDKNNKLTVGTAITQDGLAEFFITYPAHNNNAGTSHGTILVGCYGYGTDPANPFAYSTVDKRYEVPQSAQVYVVAASSDNSAITIDKGNFCFSPMANLTLTPSVDKLGVGTNTVSLVLQDANLITLPYQPVVCFPVVTKGAMTISGTDSVKGTADAVANMTDINGSASATISVSPGTEAGSGSIICSSGSTSTEITVTTPETTTTTPETPTTLTLTANPTSITQMGTTNIILTLEENSAPAVAKSITCTATPISGDMELTIETPEITTDEEDGRAILTVDVAVGLEKSDGEVYCKTTDDPTVKTKITVTIAKPTLKLTASPTSITTTTSADTILTLTKNTKPFADQPITCTATVTSGDGTIDNYSISSSTTGTDGKATLTVGVTQGSKASSGSVICSSSGDATTTIKVTIPAP